jgi:SET domain-containing protein
MKEYVPFIDKRLIMGWTEELGYGVYAQESIEANKFIEISPVVVCDNDVFKFENLSKYMISWNNKVAVPLGWTMLYNHSDKNCSDFSCNYYENLLAIVTNREIKKGEQVTVNYGPLWFSSRGISKIDI